MTGSDINPFQSPGEDPPPRPRAPFPQRLLNGLVRGIRAYFKELRRQGVGPLDHGLAWLGCLALLCGAGILLLLLAALLRGFWGEWILSR